MDKASASTRSLSASSVKFWRTVYRKNLKYNSAKKKEKVSNIWCWSRCKCVKTSENILSLSLRRGVPFTRLCQLWIPLQPFNWIYKKKLWHNKRKKLRRKCLVRRNIITSATLSATVLLRPSMKTPYVWGGGRGCCNWMNFYAKMNMTVKKSQI